MRPNQPASPAVLAVLAVLAAVVFTVGPSSLAAQASTDNGRPAVEATEATEATEAALAEGRYADARARIEAWWEAGEGGRDRTDVQKAIWLRARLTVDPEAAELLYRRLVVEFPGGEWSDQALLRLSLGARARGEADVSRRYLEILLRDYPSSPHRVEARSALAQADGVSPTAPAPTATAGRPSPPTPVPAPASNRNPVEPGEPAGAFALQFGAFGQVASATALSEDLGRAGLDVRLVRVEESPLIRVRSGRFSSRAEAESRAAELRERGFEVLISGDADREVPATGSPRI